MSRPTSHSWLASAAGLALLTSVFAVAAPANAGVKAPGKISVAIKNSSTPILTWSKVPRATGYTVEVDNDASFSSPEFTSKTVNVRAVPTSPLRPGRNYWRVRAEKGLDKSDWTSGNFEVSPIGVPVPVSPGDGAVLAQPEQPPLLRWQGSQGATGYVVEVDGDADFVGAKSYPTKTTSLVVPDPLGAGDYYWRVKADKGNGLVSSPSNALRFDVAALPAPSISYPSNDVNSVIEDVVLDWNPVAGAKSYDVEVALDASFNSRPSPPPT